MCERQLMMLDSHEIDDDTFLRGKYAATVWFLLKSGTICKIEGLDNLDADSRIVANVQRFYVGDTVQDEWIGTEKQVMTRLYIVCDSKKELASCIEEYQKKVKAIDENGDNMLLAGFNAASALGYAR